MKRDRRVKKKRVMMSVGKESEATSVAFEVTKEKEDSEDGRKGSVQT